MPRGVGKLHDATTRKRIQVSHIIKRLHDHIDGKAGMSATQVNAAKILLNKCLPDLQSIELSGEVEHSVATDKPMTNEQWQTSVGLPNQDHRPH